MSNAPKQTVRTSRPQSASNRLGIAFFFAYVSLYGTFVYAFIAKAIDPSSDGSGATSAIGYGVTLIVVSFALAVAYGSLRRRESNDGKNRSL